MTLNNVNENVYSCLSQANINAINEYINLNDIQKKIVKTVCYECSNFTRCALASSDEFTGLSKLIDIGFAKGKLSLID